jgi:hypothetical protein
LWETLYTELHGTPDSMPRQGACMEKRSEG